ncbi:MAG: alpha/beta hydrolase [Rubrivivax sp.]|nr:alpha/beta hydrolase [Rubrivivax sp.]
MVFSHANGFPAGTYRRLFDRWRAAGWRVIAVERFGHDPAFPVTSNWPRLRDQLISLVDSQAGGGGPVFLVGHSLGGYLSLLAACRRPDLAQGVVLLDSPVVAGWRAHGVQVAKATGLIKRVSPGRVSQTRRHHWPSAEAAFQHFAGKTMFARWDPEVLADYIRAGTEADPELGGVRLALSAEGRQVGMAMTRALTQGRIGWMEGSHLYPMERPDETAQAVLDVLKGMGAEAAGAPAAPPQSGS